MSGFPTRPSRASFGPTYVNKKPVVNPTQDVGANAFNLLCWQSAGMSQTSPKAVLTATVAGAAVTTVTQGLAWDPDSAVSMITFTYTAAGRFAFEFDASYNDELGNAINISLIGGTVQAMNTTSLYTGVVNMTNGYSGEARIFDSGGSLADPAAFILKLW